MSQAYRKISPWTEWEGESLVNFLNFVEQVVDATGLWSGSVRFHIFF